MIQILIKEINAFLHSLVAYIVISVFLVACGLFVWVFPESSILDYGFADMYSFFSLSPYIFLFLIPAITMRTFAEEKRAGTMELLLTRPLTDWQIIIGKFLASWLLVGFALLPTGVYYATVYELALPLGNVDTAAVIGSYIGLLLLGGVFTSVGIVASACTDNQIVSFIVAVFVCFVLYSGFSSLAQINLWSILSFILLELSIDEHYEALSKGFIDSRNVIYLCSVMLLMLWITKIVLGSRKW